jgi:diadenosine tetraphosphate (Ap4A) HIT family hydrolase
VHRFPNGAVHLRQGQVARRPRLRRRAEHDPAAGGTQVDRDVHGHVVPRRYRRNAAGTPASTGTCNPVVWDSSPAVRTTTAFATCSGSTSRLSRVRWA